MTLQFGVFFFSASTCRTRAQAGRRRRIPRPLRTPVEIWQPITSPPTADYVARERHKAVFWFHNRAMLRRNWQQALEQMERFSSQIKPRLVASARAAGVSA